MLARVYSCAVIGLDGVVVEVEVDYTAGFPGMTIVGLPDAAIQESRERVQAAVNPCPKGSAQSNIIFVPDQGKWVILRVMTGVDSERCSLDLPYQN